MLLLEVTDENSRIRISSGSVSTDLRIRIHTKISHGSAAMLETHKKMRNMKGTLNGMRGKNFLQCG